MAPEQQTYIRGTVTDESGGPLTGVCVQVKGTKNITYTDIYGGYRIGAGSSDTRLVFSFTGFETLEVKIGSRTTINVVLKSAAVTQNDVVIRRRR